MFKLIEFTIIAPGPNTPLYPTVYVCKFDTPRPTPSQTVRKEGKWPFQCYVLNSVPDFPRKKCYKVVRPNVISATRRVGGDHMSQEKALRNT